MTTNTSGTYNTKIILPVLMFMVFADLMAWGIMIPLAPGMFKDPSGIFYQALSTDNIRSVFYFLSLGIWGLGAFLGVPIFGDLADRIGRKPTVLISLIGLLLTVIWMIATLYTHAPMGFVIARFINGIFSSTFFIAQAIAVDVSDDSNRDRNIGLVMSAAALSWILAPIIPLITGLISPSNTLPFYVMGIIILLNIILVLFIIPETLKEKKGGKVSIFRLFLNTTFAFTDKRARLVYTPFILFQFGWSVYLLYFPFFALEYFGVSSLVHQALLFLIGSVGYVLGIRLQNIWVKSRSYISLIFTSSVLLLITFALYAFASYINNIWIFGIATFFAFFFNASIYLSILGYGVPYFKPHEHGMYFGSSGSIISLTFAVTVVIELLANVYIYAPFIIILGLIVVGMILTPLLRRLKKYAQ